MTDKKKRVRLGIALIPVIFLIVALSLTIGVFKQPPHIPLIGAAWPQS
jgi:NhaC family Na+:H+ antiporter